MIQDVLNDDALNMPEIITEVGIKKFQHRFKLNWFKGVAIVFQMNSWFFSYLFC